MFKGALRLQLELVWQASEPIWVLQAQNALNLATPDAAAAKPQTQQHSQGDQQAFANVDTRTNAPQDTSDLQPPVAMQEDQAKAEARKPELQPSAGPTETESDLAHRQTSTTQIADHTQPVPSA